MPIIKYAFASITDFASILMWLKQYGNHRLDTSKKTRFRRIRNEDVKEEYKLQNINDWIQCKRDGIVTRMDKNGFVKMAVGIW